jgi:hypothetical protein
VQQDEKIPGKIPRATINKIAIKAAWLIEKENEKPASSSEVMEKLNEWIKTGADEGEGLLLDFDPTKGIKYRIKSKAKDGYFSRRYVARSCSLWNESRNRDISPEEERH